ncbi:glycosyltransferase [Halonotius sp. F2-221B]|uniref:glycosyltransferase n=1 Tax=Halonotius sp. F2-221B TaxID=2731620 RepID=UPI00398BB6F3
MKVSVVVPTYSLDRYPDFCECVDALLTQTYDDVEVVVIVDGNEVVYERVSEDYGDEESVVSYLSHDDAGPLSRANMGAIQASGEVVALTDDDAVPKKDWVEQLVDAYERHDAIAVGGKMTADWVDIKAEYIPEEFYFLIGVTHRGFPMEEREVRNTFGANISFKRDVFLKLGGIKQGGIDPSSVQGRETEFCSRLGQIYGEGVIYTPDAVASHKIYQYRTEPKWLVERAFWQGYSKRAIEKLVPESSDEESEQLRRLLLRYIPRRIWNLLVSPSKTRATQLAMLFVLLAATGIGYLYGILRWR